MRAHAPKLAIALAATALVAGGAALQAKPKLTPEQRLEKLLEGREAGKPVSCISLADSRDLEILDGVALVYRSGSTLYVNRPRNPEDLDSDDVLVTRPSGSQLCRLDMVHTVDRTSYFITGFINLGDFVPYRKVKPADK
ncbi:MAG: hypothetical protein O9283_07225 [Sphingomonadaceae bacterium]|jgi:hypothetical protein|nr:hypothetical protein [Sphingomonadaceae bacterium]